MKTAVLISTGNELIHGTKADANCVFISRELFSSNLRVTGHRTVGDDVDELCRAVDEASSRADIVFITGGLGPTDDDVTIEALRKIYSFRVIEDREARLAMDRFFEGRGAKTGPADLKMVEVPEGSLVLRNPAGLAPGFILENSRCTIIAMPGVPSEMQAMFREGVIPYLERRFAPGNRASAGFKIVGRKESEINGLINSTNLLSNEISWGITSERGIASVLFLSAGESDLPGESIASEMDRLFGDSLLLEGMATPEEELLHFLKLGHLSMATAESCTGGLVSRRLTDIPGASDCFLGGVIAYSNAAKVRLLSVSEASLSEHGAVSETVAREMAEGAARVFDADVAVSVTGIAGPGGGSPEKPAGTVCFGFRFGGETSAVTRHFPGSREQVRDFSSLFVIDRLRRQLRNA